jgi:hypothetical protein
MPSPGAGSGKASSSMEGRFYDLSVERRIALAKEAQARNEPLLLRWGDVPADFGDRWDGRAALAAAWLASADAVTDLGCGSMTLKRHLRASQSYIPVDVARRDESTLVLDLNKQEDLEKLPRATACALLGVLEYCYQPDALLRAVRLAYEQVVITFNVLIPEQSNEFRLANGWVNNYTLDELRARFSEHDFRITKEHTADFERRRECYFDLR